MTETTEAYRKSRISVDRRVRTSPQDRLDMIKAYEEDLEPIMSIATRYNKSRQNIWKLLKKAGVDTSKHKIAVSCTTCGAVIHRVKSQLRNKHNVFCDMNCYQSFMDAGATHSTERRRGNRRARILVAQYFDLQPGHIVHHEDKFPLNNQLWNLRVFATHGDHIRYHHRMRDLECNKNSSIMIVEPIWNGADLNQ